MLAAFLMLYVVFMLFALPVIVGWMLAWGRFEVDKHPTKPVSSETKGGQRP